MARHGALRDYAVRLVRGDSSLLEELIQDAYVQFTTAQPDLSQIWNLDAYLATLVRNLHISSIRRAVTHRTRLVAVEDYDSAMLVLDASSTEDQLVARDTLIRICQFACGRMQTSKAASAFVLRFFHDCYPSDIARILQTTPATVHTWLSQARREARRHLAAPPRAGAGDGRAVWSDLLPAPPPPDLTDPLAYLRAAIFATARPPCLTSRAVARSSDPATPLDVATCAHIASCPRCLARICAELELPSDSGPPPADGEGGAAGGAPSGVGGTFHDQARRRARRLREHRPQQLEISINGHFAGSLRVASSHNEVSWTVRIDEPVAFAELHSGQGLRMALLHVELPPHGALTQEVRVALSDQRSLRLALDFSELHPVIAVGYLDPALQQAVERNSEDAIAALAPALTSADPDAPAARGWSWWQGVWDSWRRPSRLVPVAGAVLLLAAALWWTNGSPAEPSVAALLDQAVASETAAISASEAVHRTLVFRVRRAGAPAPGSTHRIEAWTRGDTRARAVRVFDPTGHLVAGRWLVEGRDDGIELGLFDEIWTMDLSADAFRRRYLSVGPCTRTTGETTYTLVCEQPVRTGWFESVVPTAHAQARPATVPSRAELVLRRADLHAVRLSLKVAADGVEHIVTLEEQALARLPMSDIPAGTFVAETDRLSRAPALVERPARVPTSTTPSLEVRLVEALDRLGAGDFLSVSRAGLTALSVTGLVSTVDQKKAVLRAVSALAGADVIAVDIQTFEEAAGRGRATAPTEVRLLESAIATAPIDAYLRGRRGNGQDPTAVARELTPQVLALSERLKRQTQALHAFVGRFDEQIVAELDPEGMRAWRALLDRHAANALAAIDALDATLAPYFDRDDEAAPQSPVGLRSASRRLANEATIIDDAIAAAFTAADPGTGPAQVASVLDVRHHLHRARSDARFLSGQTPQ